MHSFHQIVPFIFIQSYGGFVTARVVQRDLAVNRTFSCAARWVLLISSFCLALSPFVPSFQCCPRLQLPILRFLFFPLFALNFLLLFPSDATYAERYMGEVGPEAYERTDLSIDVRPFRNVSFLLVHGSADGINSMPMTFPTNTQYTLSVPLFQIMFTTKIRPNLSEL